jgi:iron complex transport system permease protein
MSGKSILLIALAAAAGLVLAGAPLIGLHAVDLSAVLAPGSKEHLIVFDLRLPRVLGGFLAGAGLGLSGMVFQALFRNPLAEPYTLGVSGGAAVGAGLYMLFFPALFLFAIPALALAAFAGAALTILGVYGLTRLSAGFSSTTLLLAGVVASFFCGSAVMLVQYASAPEDAFRIMRWMMGGLADLRRDGLGCLAPFVLCGSAVVFCHLRELNLLMTGEDLAASRGVEVGRVKQRLFFAVSLMVGGIVAVCGPVGFVGLMAPHICRLLVGADHRYLAPATLLLGGAFLTLCDTAARTLVRQAELPVGVITTLLGGPFFLWLLVRSVPERGRLGGNVD